MCVSYHWNIPNAKSESAGDTVSAAEQLAIRIDRNCMLLHKAVQSHRAGQRSRRKDVILNAGLPPIRA